MMSRLGRVATALLIVAGASIANPATAADTAAYRPFVPEAVGPKVHLLRTPDDFYAFAVGNVVLVEQRDGFVVIDSGMTAAHGRAVVAYARSLSSKPIKAVAITHWHNDHPQGVSAIRDAFPKVRVIATRATEEGMLGPEAFDVGYTPSPKAEAAVAARVGEITTSYKALLDDPATPPDRKERIKKALRQFDDYVDDFRGTYIVPPTETFEHQLVLNDPETPVRLMFLGRANTAGDLVAWLPKQKIVASGDIVVSPYPFGFGSYSADWIGTLGRIKALGFSTLIPGHGAPQSDATYLDKLVLTLKDLRNQILPLAQAGASLEEVKKKVDFSKSLALFGNTPRDKANVQGNFFEPMTESVYKEATGQSIVQGGGGDGAPRPRFTEPGPKSTALRHKS